MKRLSRSSIGRNARDIARTLCIIDPGNAPSMRLAKRVGYQAIGERRYHDAPIGIYERGPRMTRLDRPGPAARSGGCVHGGVRRCGRAIWRAADSSPRS